MGFYKFLKKLANIKLFFWDLYEKIKDKEIVDEFENREKSSKTNFVKIEDII